MKVVIFLFFILCNLSTAQQPVSIHLTEKDGLPDKEFYGVIEDSKGFLWFAGNKGLTRFDGENYKTFSHPEKRGLSVFEIHVDQQDRIWCVNISGQIFYVQNDEMVLFKDLQNDLKGNLPELAIYDHQLVVSSYLFVRVFDLKTNFEIKEIKNTNTDIALKPLITEDKVVFTYRNDLYTLGNNKPQLWCNLPKDLKAFNRARDVIDLTTYIGKDRTLIIYQNNNQEKFIELLDHNTWKQISVPDVLDGVRIIQVKKIADDIWVCTSKGVLLMQLIDDVLIYKNTLLDDVFSTDIIKDRDDNHWVTTTSNGIFVLPNIHIETIKLPENTGDSRVLETNGNETLYIGTSTGAAFQYDLEHKSLEQLNINGTRAVSEIIYDPYREQKSFLQDIEVTTLGKNNSIVSNLINFSTVKKGHVISPDSIMIVSSNSANVVNYKAQERDNNEYTINILKRGYTCYYDPITQDKYFAMIDEFLKINSNGKRTLLKDKNRGSIITGSIDMDNRSHLWAATFNNGLFEFKNDEVIKKWSEEDGLLSNNINKIKADGDFLWITTDRGIQRLSLKNNTFKNLTKQDGIPSYSINDIEIINNYVLFASNAGVFKIDRELTFKNFNPIEVYFTAVEINNKKVALQSSYQLPQEESQFQITFNSNGLRAMTSGNYEYRLSGLFEQWKRIPKGTNNITFTTIPQGNYTLQLRAVDTDGKTSDLEEVILEVTLPFYKENWFWIAVMLLSITGIVFYYRWKLRFRESEKNRQLLTLQKEKEMVNLKLENLRSQMNPHFVFNALNSIQEYILKNQREMAGDYLGKFADLIRTYLDHSVKGRITLQEEVDSLNMYLELEQLRFEERLQYTIVINMEEQPDHFLIPTMLIQPYVENALKHGLLHIEGERLLTIKFTQDLEQHRIICTVDDNGVGREKSKEIQSKRIKLHKSFATKATDDRISLLNYVLEKEASIETTDKFNGDKATGTLVTIKIPYTTEE
ncbi:histidine kinase [Nonlabens sp. Asnod3-A02]|uniref:sensor histidine kinase n=1 Tax=Nonlabens sp. Asnod3-A02 TaxID=3160579 RepID=UPI003868C9EF